LAELVRDSEGATQAFLNEWMHRSIQVATERLKAKDSAIDLCTEDSWVAMREMRKFSEGETGRIIGFHSAT